MFSKPKESKVKRQSREWNFIERVKACIGTEVTLNQGFPVGYVENHTKQLGLDNTRHTKVKYIAVQNTEDYAVAAHGNSTMSSVREDPVTLILRNKKGCNGDRIEYIEDGISFINVEE